MVADLSKGAQAFSPENMPLLVVKIGSALLIEQDGEIRLPWLAKLVAELADRRKAGQKIVVVSSGAIALGARRLKLPKGGRASLADAQASAAVGQISLSGLWAQLFEEQGVATGQLLLTLSDFEDRQQYLCASETMRRLIELDVVPIINENDSLTTQEIRFGDNDRLAARVAQACYADGVVLLSDIDGLYDRNPADEGAVHIAHVRELTEEIRAMADGRSASGMGSGGMAVKLEAARIACIAGIPLAIISGKDTAPLAAWDQGARGTIFWPDRNENARKSWLGALQLANGEYIIDDGAAAALQGGNSLLAVGLLAVQGAFARGDVVDIATRSGTVLARGLSEYDSTDAAKIIGLRSEEIEAVLGYSPRSALIHRDHMVMI